MGLITGLIFAKPLTLVERRVVELWRKGYTSATIAEKTGIDLAVVRATLDELGGIL